MTFRVGRPDKSWVGASFGRAAITYDSAARLQRHIASDLIRDLRTFGGSPRMIIDVGAGTGYSAEALHAEYPTSDLILLDIAEGMLAYARSSRPMLNKAMYLCADTECMPIKTQVCDLVISSLALQWCPNLSFALNEISRILITGTTFAVSLLIGETLAELRDAWSDVDQKSHVSDFIVMEELLDKLAEAGFEVVLSKTAKITVPYRSVLDLMRELKHLGARNLTQDRPRGLTGKAKFSKMISAYEANQTGDQIISTYEVANCVCIKQ